MAMHNPPHPGEILRDTLIEGENLTVTDAAKLLDISRVQLSKIINGQSGISPETAIRLSIVLNTSSQMWVNLQTDYDLWFAEKKRKRLSHKLEKIKEIYKK